MLQRIIIVSIVLFVEQHHAMELHVRADSFRHDHFVRTKLLINGRWHTFFLSETHVDQLHEPQIVIELNWMDLFESYCITEKWYFAFKPTITYNVPVSISTSDLLECSQRFIERVPKQDLSSFLNGSRYVKITKAALPLPCQFKAAFHRIYSQQPDITLPPSNPPQAPSLLPATALTISLDHVRDGRLQVHEHTKQSSDTEHVPTEKLTLVSYDFYNHAEHNSLV